MAAEPLFMDSGGFYALVSPDSETHELAVEIMQAAAQERRRAVTTDYIIDETATLLRARGLTKLLAEFFRLAEESHLDPEMHRDRPHQCPGGAHGAVSRSRGALGLPQRLVVLTKLNGNQRGLQGALATEVER